MLQNLACMIKHPMGIQIYDQISILRSTSKVKLCRTVLLGFGLKIAKIALNIVKVGMNSYFPNADLYLWLNFNFENLVKCETPLYSFSKVGIKADENISQHREISCASLSIKWTSKTMSKFQLWETAQKWNSVVQFH